MVALLSYLKLSCLVCQIDREKEEMPRYILPNESATEPPFTFLFRPGHYDLLYSKEQKVT